MYKNFHEISLEKLYSKKISIHRYFNSSKRAFRFKKNGIELYVMKLGTKSAYSQY